MTFLRQLTQLHRQQVYFIVRTLIKPQFVRFKYTPNSGVKGLTGRKFNNGDAEDIALSDDSDLFKSSDYDCIVNSTMNVTKNILNIQKVIVLQPYIKWGPRKSSTNPELALQEAEALVRSIPTWTVEYSTKVPLESLDKQSLFGTGKIEELKHLVDDMRHNGQQVTCVFVSKSTLTARQKRNLEKSFGIPVIDRYSVVIQIMRLHAVSMESKLQVAMAEIPYIWTQAKGIEDQTSQNMRCSLTDTQKEILKDREKKIKNKLTQLRDHRELLRNKRTKQNIPIIAVVGYTNAGKTSLIKALTNEQRLQPKNQLFATLDVTAHTGILPSNLKVIYMDTVGFMSEIPTGLIECFIATLEDAMLADAIIHVQDVSHENYVEQRKHVEETLQSLLKNSNNVERERLFNNVINVGNKIDLLESADLKQIHAGGNLQLVSAKTLNGINDLMENVEKKILKFTGRKKITIRVPMGCCESIWLYKNSAVTAVVGDPHNQQKCLMTVIITEAKLNQFRHIFVGK